MKRRTVLKAGMGGLVGVAALESGCATAPAQLDHADAADPAVAEAALARIDARMASFAQLDFDIPKDLPHHLRQTLETRAELARRTFRSLYLAGAFQQLDEPLRYHPGMQERIRRMQGEMDQTVHGVTEDLASLSPAERKQVQQQLAADPELGPSLAQHIQDVAREDGFRLGQRAQLRYAFSDLERRMRTQNASAVIDRSVERSRAARARAGRMDERAWAAQAGEATFRDLKQRAFAHAARWEHVYAARPRFDLARLDEVYPDDGGGAGVPTREDFQGERTTKPPDQAQAGREPEQQGANEAPASGAGRSVLSVGGVLLGIGAITEVGGLLLYFGVGSANSSLMFVGGLMCIYIGPLLLAAGLLVAVAGFVMTLTSGPRSGGAPPSRKAPEQAPDPGQAMPAPQI